MKIHIMYYGEGIILSLKHLKVLLGKIIVSISISTLLFAALPIFNIEASAAAYTITEANGALFACNGTEVFSDADTSTFVTTLPVNTPVLVTGSTSNGFWRIDLNGTPFFVSMQALSMQPNTTAYKLTSLDAKAALAMNVSNGKILYSLGATDRLEPASTTKIMTALLTIEAIEAGQIALETPVVVSASSIAGMPRDASHVDPRIQAGEIPRKGRGAQKRPPRP